MGAGKTTLGEEVARRLQRRFVDLDHEIERQTGSTIEELFARDGEPGFRATEESVAAAVLDSAEPAVIALGGGTVLSPTTRETLSRRAFTVLLEVDPELAWRRASEGGRPLAVDEQAFRALYFERLPIYEEAADGRAHDAEGVVLAAAGIDVRVGALELLEELVPGTGAVEIVADANVAGIHGVTAQLALGDRDIASHDVPPGEHAKTLAVLERLWRSLRIGRDGTIVGLGGGCTTDLAGFAAATYMRGVPWVAVPTTLVGQVDAAIGGKTAVDLPGGKNLVGAFHQPAAVLADPETLATLPAREAAAGAAEAVKAGILGDAALFGLLESSPEAVAERRADVLGEVIRRAIEVKRRIVEADEREAGERALLNLGHTFGHALETLRD